MLFRERLARDKDSDNGNLHRMYIDNKVLSAVAGQYSQMDQEHARIREEALAVSSSQRVNVAPLNDGDISSSTKS